MTEIRIRIDYLIETIKVVFGFINDSHPLLLRSTVGIASLAAIGLLVLPGLLSRDGDVESGSQTVSGSASGSSSGFVESGSRADSSLNSSDGEVTTEGLDSESGVADGGSTAPGWSGESTSEASTAASAVGEMECDPNYSPCVPYVSYDLNCPDIGYMTVRVIGYDRHGFDRDRDGFGCE